MRLGLRHEIAVEATASGCWFLPHKVRSDGYVRVSVLDKRQYAHRYVYETLVGTIKPKYELDHLCRNRACVNPDHMEQVTHLENCRRGVPRCAKLTQCKRGHSLMNENAYVRNGRRHCRTCRAAYARTHARTS